MSTKAVIDFVEHVAGSQDLEKEFDSIAQFSEAGAERMSEFGMKHGFEFSPEEFTQVTQAAFEASGGELNEEELGKVSGGILVGCYAAAGIILNNLGALKINKTQTLP